MPVLRSIPYDMLIKRNPLRLVTGISSIEMKGNVSSLKRLVLPCNMYYIACARPTEKMRPAKIVI